MERKEKKKLYNVVKYILDLPEMLVGRQKEKEEKKKEKKKKKKEILCGGVLHQRYRRI